MFVSAKLWQEKFLYCSTFIAFSYSVLAFSVINVSYLIYTEFQYFEIFPTFMSEKDDYQYMYVKRFISNF